MTRRRPLPRTLRLLLVASWILAPRCASAESVGAFPNLEPWPSTLALGGAPKALGEGVEAVLDNPTGMLRGEDRALAFSHASLFAGGFVHHQAAAFVLPLFEESNRWRQGQVLAGRGKVHTALGLGITNLSGELPGDDTYGETQVAFALAHRFGGGMGSGARLRLLQARSTVDGSGGTGAALDVGLEGSWGGWRIGGVARAIFSRVNYDRSIDGPLPAGFDVAVERAVASGLKATVGATFPSTGKPSRLALGLGWLVPRTPLVLMAGPAWRNDSVESRAEIAAGMSVRVGPVQAEYGMRTGPDALGEIHRFGLQVFLP